MSRFLTVLYVTVFFFLFVIHLLVQNLITLILMLAWLIFVVTAGRKLQAKVLPEKQLRVKVYAKGNAIGSEAKNSTYECNLSFRLPDGAVWTFPVSPDFYNTVSEGDEGTLVYKQISSNRQAYFVRFERDED